MISAKPLLKLNHVRYLEAEELAAFVAEVIPEDDETDSAEVETTEQENSVEVTAEISFEKSVEIEEFEPDEKDAKPVSPPEPSVVSTPANKAKAATDVPAYVAKQKSTVTPVEASTIAVKSSVKPAKSRKHKEDEVEVSLGLEIESGPPEMTKKEAGFKARPVAKISKKPDSRNNDDDDFGIIQPGFDF